MSDNYTQDFIDEVKGCRTPTVSGEGGVDLAVREALDNHTADGSVHYTDQKVINVTSDIFSNPNQLINGDFRHAINQRGQTEYNIVDDANSYSIDRWRSASGFKIMVDDGLVIEPTTAITGNVAGIVQAMDATPFIGKTLTFSSDVEVTNDYAHMIMYATTTNGTFVRSTAKIQLEQGVNKVTIENIPDTAKKLWAQFTINSGANVGDTLKLNWAKLELGSVATPFTPPELATELVKCQRYFASQSIVKNGYYGPAYADRENYAILTAALPVTIRGLPTIVYTADNLALFDGVNTINVTALEVHAMMGNEITLRVLAEGLTVGKSYLLLATDNTTIAYSAEL